MKKNAKEEHEKIIVADDEPSIIELVTEILDDIGYAVCPASNIKEAENILKKEKIVLAITDIYMPDGTGLDLARKIKLVSANIPVIIMTGTPKSENIQQSVDIEVDAYLIKPISPDKLLSLVKELLNT